jgi:iron-sulfur cluster assembly protein
MITISDAAADKIKEMLAAEQSPNLFLRVGVRPGGCSGFSYGIGFDDDRKETDQVFEIQGLTVVVDRDSSKYLQGVEIDFRETGMGGGFTFHNPNAVATCGCGASFRHKEEEGAVEKCDA